MKNRVQSGGGQGDVEVIFRNNDVIVVNKPAGLLTHPTSEKPNEPSVAGIFKSEVEDADELRPGIVHRLDKDTSGVMILARNPKTKEFLQAQFKDRAVRKQYLSLVWGRMPHARARLELPIARSLQKGNTMRVSHAGKMAVSEYAVEREFSDFDLLQIELMTGRTHQIRVQLAHLCHPVVGDTQYGRKPMPEGLSRQFLHSYILELQVALGVKKSFEAPLSHDLQEFLNGLDQQ
ncbi:RNA pseudouridine synthase [Candidatus Saccharibacteria bacterium]|nr:RNA pseudouridine synthase [Candidatus Saccharibacteria bacterium]